MRLSRSLDLILKRVFRLLSSPRTHLGRRRYFWRQMSDSGYQALSIEALSEVDYGVPRFSFLTKLQKISTCCLSRHSTLFRASSRVVRAPRRPIPCDQLNCVKLES